MADGVLPLRIVVGIGGDVQGYPLLVQRHPGQGHIALPADEIPHGAPGRVHHREVIPVRIAPDHALTAGGLELAVVQGLALRGDHHVSVIQRTGDGVALGIAHTDIDTQLPGAAEELTHLRPVGQQGVVVVHLPVLAAHGLAAAHGEAEGHAVGVAGDEQLRKDNELRALAGGLVDEPQGLLKTFVLAEHHRGGLHHRHAAGVLQISHGSTSLQNDTMIIPDGHAGTQQVSAQDAAAVVQRGEFRLHAQAVRAANSTHRTGSQDRFRLCIIRPVLSVRHEKRRAEGVGKPLPPYGKQTADAAPT